jgi:protein-S-isoprenylcysteine O-methyltransferase Ste14
VLAGQGGEAVGMFLLVCGLSFAGWGLVTFLRAGTAILPHHPAARLVRHGPYRFTRNPMYAGLTAAYAGLSLVAGLAWPLLVLPIVLVALRVLVVNREERYLQAAFPEAYAEYRRRVRRWV